MIQTGRQTQSVSNKSQAVSEPSVSFWCVSVPSIFPCVVFIDHAYLKLVANYFGMGGRYDVHRFASILSQDAGLACAHAYSYTAPPYQNSSPTEDEKRRKAGYDRFVGKLTVLPAFTVREGRCQKICGEYNQKGVDTLLVMDLTRLPQMYPNVKNAVVITSDTDFVPVLNNLREQGIRVILYYYSDYVRNSRFSMSNHLFTACDECRIISRRHFERSPLK